MGLAESSSSVSCWYDKIQHEWNNYLDRVLFVSCPEASLEWIRRGFGFLMACDTLTERGMLTISSLWGPQVRCHFPLLPFVPFPSLNGLRTVYAVMLLSAIGMLTQVKPRLCSALYCLTFWYTYSLDVSLWNNHSYLFGLLAFLFCIETNFREQLSDSEKTIPAWIYHLFRFQIFIVYCFAGIKKWDADWLNGFPVAGMSKNWALLPLRFTFGAKFVDLYFIHWMGFMFDLFIGCFLLWEKTRIHAFVLCCYFHFVNSTAFNIGMFPFAMMTVSLVFFSPDWPAETQSYIRRLRTSRHEIRCRKPIEKLQKPGRFKNIIGMLIFLYILIQILLPFSHGVLKGYNTWGNSLYGYSWDMMIHNWQVQHVKLTLENKSSRHNNHRRNLKADIWTVNNRFAYQAVLAKKLANCIAEMLPFDGGESPAVFLDVWIAMNGGFKQRIYRPEVDLVTAPWSLFSPVEWVLPVIMDRLAFDNLTSLMSKKKRAINPNVTLVYIADFPGYSLTQFVPKDLGSVTVDLLQGTVNVSTVSGPDNEWSYSRILFPNEGLSLPNTRTSTITVTGEMPAIYLLALS